MDPFSNVYPTLLGCFGIILAGYIFGRLNLITQSQGKGLELYIAKVALPALLFKSLLELDFTKVDWHFWYGILLSKAALFVIVAVLTLVTTQNDMGKAGLFGIFVTQSNDLALGLPLFDAIYKEYHPEYCQYLYLLIPVSVAFLNPIGFLLLEFQKSTNESNANGKLKIVWKASKRVITNPLVFMVVLGLVFNFALNGTKQYTGFNSSHWFLSPFLSVIGNSFGSTALFYLGLNLVGSMKDYSGFTLVVPFLLVSCKSLIFPVLARQAVYWLCTNSSASGNATTLSSFAFLYGTLPTAPPVAVYATMYNAHVETISTSMVLGTFLSAPIMFVSSKMILVMKSEGGAWEHDFFKALFDTGILSTVCCIWVFFVMFTTKYYRKVLHQCTIALITCQLLLGLTTSLSKHYYDGSGYRVILALFLIGLFGSTSWTALVSFTLTVVRCKGENFASKRKFIFFLIGVCFPIAVGTYLALANHDQKANPSKNCLLQYIQENIIFNWLYGFTQTLTVIACIGSLIILQRCDKYCRCRNMSRTSESEQLLEKDEIKRNDSWCKRCKDISEKQKDIDDIFYSSCDNPSSSKTIQGSYRTRKATDCEKDSRQNKLKADTSRYGAISPIAAADESQFVGLKDIEDLTLEEYLQGDSHQLTRHVILILFLCFFSILNIFLCFERIRNNDMAHGSGVYIEIEFLAITCTVGQGFLSFAVFGFNKIFFNFISFERLGFLQPSCFARKIKITTPDHLDQRISDICQRFRAHHFDNCIADLVCDLRFHFKTYKRVFRGDKLVDWIIEFGLADNRMDAVYYGNCLLQGKVIQHCMNEHLFYDLPYFYRFCTENLTSSLSV